ncbi:MAG: cryptochrome/photolyase family protein [Acidimicrobiales bacterium]
MTGISAPVSLIWFRRDLRLADNPALVQAAESGRLAALFVIDPRLWGPSGPARRRFLLGCLASLDSDLRNGLGGSLIVAQGQPDEVVPQVAARLGAGRVFIAADFGPYGQARDRRVARALGRDHRELVEVGSPYVVEPGSLPGPNGGYRVFGAFRRAWEAADRSLPIDPPTGVRWIGSQPPAAEVLSNLVGPVSDAGASGPSGSEVGPEGSGSGSGSRRFDEQAAGEGSDQTDQEPLVPGEAAALVAMVGFLNDGLGDYAVNRNRPDLAGTSRLSPHLRWGCIHPRQLLARLDRSASAGVFRSELCWREFYADILHRQPDSARSNWSPALAEMKVDTGASARERLEVWKAGRTGFPLVDAGMRQLAGQAWMHNRVRMVTASFLIKDLHLPWQWGARHFMKTLVDGDLASNSHGWQWTAGTGTDPAPYFRVFNPTRQGLSFDPDGDYVRRWVPELRHIPGPDVHQPRAQGALFGDYPEPMVDHRTERDEALRRYHEARGSRAPAE